jgi:plastocyanin
MRKLGRLLVLLFAMLVAGTGAAFAIGGAKPPPPKVVKIVNASSSCAEFCFRPAQLRVPLNTAVTWKNTSVSIHTVTRCTKAACAGNNGGTGTDKGPSSGTVSPGKSYTFVFKHKGTYTYYCQVHGFTVMHGTITVG